MSDCSRNVSKAYRSNGWTYAGKVFREILEELHEESQEFLEKFLLIRFTAIICWEVHIKTTGKNDVNLDVDFLRTTLLGIVGRSPRVKTRETFERINTGIPEGSAVIVCGIIDIV